MKPMQSKPQGFVFLIAHSFKNFFEKIIKIIPLILLSSQFFSSKSFQRVIILLLRAGGSSPTICAYTITIPGANMRNSKITTAFHALLFSEFRMINLLDINSLNILIFQIYSRIDSPTILN